MGESTHSDQQIHYLPITTGLNATHEKELPLIEHIETFPNLEGRSAFRLYDDGAFYQITSLSVPSPTWQYISTLAPEGLDSLQVILEEWCSKESTEDPLPLSSASGSLTWKFAFSTCHQEYTVPWGTNTSPFLSPIR